MLERTVRLHAPLRQARAVDPDAPLPPLPSLAPRPAADIKAPTPPPVQMPVAPPTPTVPPAPPPPPAPTLDDLYATEKGRLLREERQLIEQTLSSLSRVVRELREQRSQERIEWRRAAVELGVTLATRLLHDQIASDAFPIETVVRELLEQFDRGPITVFLHPLDVVLLQRRLDGKPLSEQLEGLKIEEDPTLGRGDCRVETADEVVLAQLETQLAETRQRLLRSLGHVQS